MNRPRLVATDLDGTLVRSDGSIGQYGAHPERKRFLLDLEAG